MCEIVNDVITLHSLVIVLIPYIIYFNFQMLNIRVYIHTSTYRDNTIYRNICNDILYRV